ncbi:hypothetical protein PORCRE_1284 [Porphyromonas crevioricanis JCM 15906]|uniref:Uncharacterized protein n=1 Tax=Porphyromonas crevioricanis JCM 15906 TaxID=1305617 RepID=T1DT32_9PORP|nr:hypothetical protein PORCRE_1284 [Porphyromonas crevioricanis JCM 15906]
MGRKAFLYHRRLEMGRFFPRTYGCGMQNIEHIETISITNQKQTDQ